MSSLAIVEAFSELPDPRRGAGCRHEYAVCLALFTLAISAGCGGFLAIGDWLKAYREPLIALFGFPKHGIPSYSTLRRTLLDLDYQSYGACVASFCKIEPKRGETMALDGKVLRGSYNIETGDNRTPSHPAIQLVTVYLVERGLILTPQQVDCKTNEIKAIPPVLEALAQRGVVFDEDALNTQKKLVS
ncbi:ISAs1 family transposase [Microcoleus sp. BR0-C5]